MNNDRLAKIITVVTIVIFLVFAFTITRQPEPLQGGDIQKAIEQDQYR